MALVVDTGVLLAALNQDDPDHESCIELLQSADEPLVVPVPVLVELDYWLRKLTANDAWLVFCEDVAAGAYSLHSIDGDLLVTAAQLQTTYADQPIGFVDASVVVTCEALGESKVATLDQCHFDVLRTGNNMPLRIVPD